MLSGNKQYPSRQMLWKKLIVPPSSCPLIAIIAPPSQTITNTISKSSVLSSAFVAADKTLKCKTYICLRCQHETEEERAPQVPISDFLSFFGRVCHWLDGVDNNPKFLPDSLQISLLSIKGQMMRLNLRWYLRLVRRECSASNGC